MPCNCRHLRKLKEARVSIDETASVYLDYNAACPPDSAVLAQYQNSAIKIWAHPDAPHLAGQRALDHKEELENRWKEISGMHEGSIYFCRGSSEALSLLLGNLKDTPPAILTSSCEHNTVLEQSQNWCRERNVPLIRIDVGRNGKIKTEILQEKLEEYPGSLFIYSPVNHETGAIQNCRQLWTLCVERSGRIFMDAPQAMARLEGGYWLPYTHGYSISGQKIYGLKGTGVCVLKKELALCTAAVDNWGTPDIPAASSLTKAVELYSKELPELRNYWKVLCREGIGILSSGDFKIEVLSPEDHAPGILCISLPDLLKYPTTMEDLFYHLNRDGIFLSRFSACTGTVNGSSRILDKMGFTGILSRSSLRISLGKKSKRDDFFRLKSSISSFFSLHKALTEEQ